MTVKELKQKLSEMDDNLTVTICDYEDDSNESFNFLKASGVETINARGNEFICIFKSDKDYIE